MTTIMTVNCIKEQNKSPVPPSELSCGQAHIGTYTKKSDCFAFNKFNLPVPTIKS